MLSRRTFLTSSGAAISVAFAGLRQALAAGPRAAGPGVGLGPLRSDSDGRVDLPEGFRYSIVSAAGETMDDGLLVPDLHDGMATFARDDGRTLIVRNHENMPEGGRGAFGAGDALLGKIDQGRLYDDGHGKLAMPGGTTTLVFDTATQKLERHWLSLGGTLRNCAGGPTPWGSWISCEESVIRADDTYARDHGFNFEVPAGADGLVPAAPLTAMGRFNHEAIAVHAPSGVVYQTEDQHDSLLYRFVPDQPGRLAEGGRLQALRVLEAMSLDTRNWHDLTHVPVGRKLAVDWVDLHNVSSPNDDLRHQGFLRGAARFARGEGMWAGDGEIYFACTIGGAGWTGQIWRYVPSAAEGTEAEGETPGQLELFVEPNDPGLLRNCDNITVAPWGDLIVCEDTIGMNRVQGITPRGEIYPIASNLVSEFAGATFSPDGTTLFVNVQLPGWTLAITGPWERARQEG